MEKISVLFVCLGNICRSPAAEALFIQQIKERGIEDRFLVDSAGTGSWHVGKKADKRMRLAAKNRKVDITSKARQINGNDFQKFNYILTMDDSNYNNVISIKNREKCSDLCKVIKIQEFASSFYVKEVPDPYFGGEEGFDYVLDILTDSISGFLDYVFKNHF
tara:strand:- start:1557 stop:2042 length:486 start_codon:yes stop_codon:yes gene_type:complete